MTTTLSDDEVRALTARTLVLDTGFDGSLYVVYGPNFERRTTITGICETAQRLLRERDRALDDCHVLRARLLDEEKENGILKDQLTEALRERDAARARAEEAEREVVDARQIRPRLHHLLDAVGAPAWSQGDGCKVGLDVEERIRRLAAAARESMKGMTEMSENLGEETDTLRGQVSALRDVLGYYADPQTWTGASVVGEASYTPLVDDISNPDGFDRPGKRARDALDDTEATATAHAEALVAPWRDRVGAWRDRAQSVISTARNALRSNDLGAELLDLDAHLVHLRVFDEDDAQVAREWQERIEAEAYKRGVEDTRAWLYSDAGCEEAEARGRREGIEAALRACEEIARDLRDDAKMHREAHDERTATMAMDEQDGAIRCAENIRVLLDETSPTPDTGRGGDRRGGLLEPRHQSPLDDTGDSPKEG